jgi:hypothetical protein
MPFLTKIDSNAEIKGSRDPLGAQALWTSFGRRIVGNLTTVSTSLRDFTATILGYAFVERMEGEASEVELFLRWEQWAAYCRVYRFQNVFVRGIERVNERLVQSKRVTISASREHQILSNQKTYGLWGLYSMPARASGLLETDARLTPETREFIEAEYWPRVKAVEEKLRLNRFMLELDGSHKRLAETVADVLAPPAAKPLSGAEHQFYTEHLLHRSPTQKRAAASIPAELKQTFTPTPALLIAWAERAAKRDTGLAGMLDDVRVIESLLAPAARLFSFLLGERKQLVSTIAKSARDTWGKPFARLDIDRLNELRGRIRGAAGDRAESDQQWLDVAQALISADYEQVIRTVCDINASVMQNRGGGPWVTIENGRLRVHAMERSRPLPSASELGSLWEHSYFLNSLAIMAATLES